MKIKTIILITIFSTLLLVSGFTQVTADFTADITSGCNLFTVQFTNNSTGTGDLSFFWDFGNGDTSTFTNPSTLYSLPGTYDVMLIVSNGTDNDTLIREGYINSYNNPASNFTNMTDTIGCIPLTAEFQNLSLEGDAEITQWIWDFGDGITSEEENPVHTYYEIGLYNVKLTIKDENECTDSMIKEEYIQLFEISASFILEKDTICPGELLPLTNASVGASLYIWDFGNGESSIEENPYYYYADSGLYVITLIIYSEIECFSSFSDTVYVDFIKANFTTDTSYSCQVPFTVQYSNYSNNAVSYEWHFGNGKLSTETNPANIFELTPFLENNNNETYTDTLYAINEYGCINKYYPDSNNVRINLPKAKFTPNDEDYENPDELTGCAPLSINFINTGTFNSPFETIKNYYWEFGDGNTSTETNASNTFIDTNQYVMSLSLTTTYGCVNTFLATVKVGDKHTADFELSGDSALCASDSAVFIDLSTDANFINEWLWLFGDGLISREQNPYHFFLDTGYMDVDLVAYHNGCPSDTVKYDSIVKIKGPVSAFSFDLNCDQPFNYEFTGNIIDETEFSWDFGDGFTNNTDTFLLHTYLTTNDYNVILSAVNDSNICSYEYEQVIKVRDVKAAFVQDTLYGCQGLKVILDASESIDFSEFEQDGDTGFFLWMFGDSPLNILTGDTLITHVFNNRGQTTVELIIKGENGCIDTAASQVKIYKPIVNFSSDNTLGCMPLSVSFNNTTISDTVLSTYEWHFGDNLFSSQKNPLHIYNDIGIFTVFLKATDIMGCSDTIIKEDYITAAKPVPVFSVSDQYLCSGNTIQFISNSLGNITNWLWNFGDGFTSIEENPIHIYNDTGYFSVSLYLTDIFGCDSLLELTDLIHVQAIPEVDFIADDTTASCWPATISFTDQTASSYIINWEWDFGDGSAGSILQYPVKTYTKPGYYDITLNVETTYGCKGSLKKENYINIFGAYAEILTVDSACPKETVMFIIANKQNVYDFNWVFEGGITNNYDTAYYAFDSYGNHFSQLILYSYDEACPPKLIEDTIYIHEFRTGFSASDSIGCIPLLIEFTDTSLNGISPSWNFGDGTISEGSSVNHTYENDGYFLIQLFNENEYGCKDTAYINVVIHALPTIKTSNDTLLCLYDTITITAQGGEMYSWIPVTGLINPDTYNPKAHPEITRMYNVTGTDQNACTGSDSILITVQQVPLITGIISDTSVVIGEFVQLYAEFDQGATYYWRPVDELDFPDSLNPTVKITESITCIFTVIDSNQCFEVTEDVYIEAKEVYSVDVPTAFTPNGDGENDFIYVKGWGIFKLVEFRIYNRLGQIVFKTDNINEGWDGNFKNMKQAVGTYVYSVIIESYDGRQRSKTGSFLLLR